MTTKKNIVKLKTDPIVNFTTIGISSHENDYRLLWSINNQLGLSFSQSESLSTDSNKKFARFIHKDEDHQLVLVANRCDDGFLLEKHKNLDFILKFETLLSEDEVTTWLRDLRKTSLISAAFQIPISSKILQLLG